MNAGVFYIAPWQLLLISRLYSGVTTICIYNLFSLHRTVVDDKKYISSSNENAKDIHSMYRHMHESTAPIVS